MRNPGPRSPAAKETGKPAPIPAKTSTAPTDIPYEPSFVLVYVRLVAAIERPFSGVRRSAPEPDSRWKSDPRTSLWIRIAPPGSVTLASGTACARAGIRQEPHGDGDGIGAGLRRTRSVRHRLPFMPFARADAGMTRRCLSEPRTTPHS